jgi:DNA-binding NtrC family response regulator
LNGERVRVTRGASAVSLEEDRKTPSVLVVESDAVIGMSLAEELEEDGYGVAGPFSCAGALGWLKTSTPDSAVLDVDLQSGPCVELARQLRSRGIPFVVFSSHDQSLALEEFRNVPWIAMPAYSETLSVALRELNRAPGR